MSNNNCGCRFNCTSAAIIGSVIIGIVTVFLRLMAVITVTPAFLWVVFGIAVVYLALTLLTTSFTNSDNQERCLPTLTTLLIGILGTILFAIILLAIPFVATSIVGAIITGVLLAFFSLTITTTACYVKCISKCND